MSHLPQGRDREAQRLQLAGQPGPVESEPVLVQDRRRQPLRRRRCVALGGGSGALARGELGGEAVALAHHVGQRGQALPVPAALSLSLSLSLPPSLSLSLSLNLRPSPSLSALPTSLPSTSSCKHARARMHAHARDCARVCKHTLTHLLESK
jgi:hypothetical protein